LDDLLLASGTVFNQVHLWKVVNVNDEGYGQVSRELIGHEGVIFGVRFSQDGSMLASVSDDRTIRVWSLTNVKQAPLVVYGHTARVWDCQFVDEYLVSISEDSTCRVWKNGLMATRINENGGIDMGDSSMDCLACWEGHVGKNIWSCAISPDHKMVATGGQDSGVRLWSLTSIKENNIGKRNSCVY
jgi:WD40 repeat protein